MMKAEDRVRLCREFLSDKVDQRTICRRLRMSPGTLSRIQNAGDEPFEFQKRGRKPCITNEMSIVGEAGNAADSVTCPPLDGWRGRSTSAASQWRNNDEHVAEHIREEKKAADSPAMQDARSDTPELELWAASAPHQRHEFCRPGYSRRFGCLSPESRSLSVSRIPSPKWSNTLNGKILKKFAIKRSLSAKSIVLPTKSSVLRANGTKVLQFFEDQFTFSF